MSPDETRMWFEDWLDALNRHDLDEVRSHLASDVRRAHLPRGADAWVAGLADLFRAFPDYQWKRITLVVEGDRVAAHLRARGTHRGAFDGIAATGRHVNVAEFAFYRLAGPGIVEAAGTDGTALLAQLRS